MKYIPVFLLFVIFTCAQSVAGKEPVMPREFLGHWVPYSYGMADIGWDIKEKTITEGQLNTKAGRIDNVLAYRIIKTDSGRLFLLIKEEAKPSKELFYYYYILEKDQSDNGSDLLKVTISDVELDKQAWNKPLSVHIRNIQKTDYRFSVHETYSRR